MKVRIEYDPTILAKRSTADLLIVTTSQGWAFLFLKLPQGYILAYWARSNWSFPVSFLIENPNIARPAIFSQGWSPYSSWLLLFVRLLIRSYQSRYSERTRIVSKLIEHCLKVELVSNRCLKVDVWKLLVWDDEREIAQIIYGEKTEYARWDRKKTRGRSSTSI
jgi:hypothetical protein